MGPLDISLWQHWYRQNSFAFLDIIGQRKADTPLEGDGLGVPIGSKTPSSGAFTTLSASGTATLQGVVTLTAQPILSSLTASRGIATDGNKGLISLDAPAQTFLGSDVALNNTANYFNIVNTGSIGGAGQTWLLIATACLYDTAGGAVFRVRIWDGSSAVFIESTTTSPSASAPINITLPIIVTPSAATTYHLSAKDANSTSGAARTSDTSGTANKATSITAIRLI